MPRGRGIPDKSTVETHGGRMVFKSGGGCLTFFGLPFFCAGLFLVLTVLGVVKPKNADEIAGGARVGMFLMGLAFTSVGAGLSFGRKWVVVDKVGKRATERWGLLVPMKSREHRLSDYDMVGLSLQTGKKNSPDTYPVELLPRDQGKRLVLEASSEYATSLAQAEAVAKFLDLPLKDRSGGGEVLIDPDDMGLSFAERAKEEEGEAWAARPPELRTRVRHEGRAVVLEIPGPGPDLSMILGAAVPIVVALWFGSHLLTMFREGNAPDFVRYIFFGFLGFFFMLLPLLGLLRKLLRAGRNQAVVRADARGLSISGPGAGKKGEVEIPASDIVGVDAPDLGKLLRSGIRSRSRALRPGDPFSGEPPAWLTGLARLVPSKGVVVRSRKGIFTFGRGLAPAEIAYLRSLVVQALQGEE